MVPSDYGGVTVTDRGRSYACPKQSRIDSQALARVKQQKCLAYVLRSIREVVDTKNGRGRSFGNRLKQLLGEAIGVWQASH